MSNIESNEVLERNILGTMLQENYLINDSLIKVEHFINTIHKNIFNVMKELAYKQLVADMATLIATAEHPEQLGGINYLASLESYGNIEKFDSWEQLLLEAYQQRVTKNILQNALSDDWALDQTIMALSKVELQSENDLTTAYEESKVLFNMPFIDKPQREGVKTGLTKFDMATGGLVNGELVIAAARPSMGKTDLLINFAIGSQTKNKNILTLIFSLEMSNQSLSGRFVCNIGKINRNKLKNPQQAFTDGQKEQWPKVIGDFSAMNIHFYDRAGQSVSEIRSKIRKAVRENPEKQVVVFIDYLTLIAPEDKKAIPHVQVSQISRDLKILAKDFDIPVFCLAQLSRAVEQRNNKRPMLSDLRESGSIEQDADIVVLLYRESYYNADKADDETLELNIAKNRAGGTGTIFTEYNRFTGVIRDGNR